MEKIGTSLETTLSVMEVSFFIDEKIYTQTVEPDKYYSNTYEHILEKKSYGPFLTREIAEEEVERLKKERPKVFENLPPLVQRAMDEPYFNYEIREERKQIKKEVSNETKTSCS
jgi:hypothetical protein